MQNIFDAIGQRPETSLGFVLGSLAILALVTIVVSAILGRAWRRVREAENLAALKHEMVVRGLSADEIARIIDAGQPRRGWACHSGRAAANGTFIGRRAHA